jgi:hypothetical protein
MIVDRSKVKSVFLLCLPSCAYLSENVKQIPVSLILDPGETLLHYRNKKF